MKKIRLFAVVAIMALALCACGKKDEPANEDNNTPAAKEQATPEDTDVAEAGDAEEPVAAEEATPEPTEDPHKGKVQSKLTGKYISPKKAKKRPYAVMINNIQYAAQFQSGLSNAAVLYEAKVEGGITRLLGIFESTKGLNKIGSVRSARHYYVSVADEYDAVFVHYGHTKFALSKIDKLGVDNISGLSGIGGKVFYRDNSIKAPHNAFASDDGLKAGMKALKYRKNYKDDFEGHFKFYEEDTDLEKGKTANKVTVQFSGYTAPYFVYDAENKVYKRFQYGKAHMDASNNKQLAFKNLIIECVDDEPIVPGHPKDYRTIKFENAKGKGKYITNGKAINITWEKNENKHYCKFFAEDGTELQINPGKTYIALLPDENSKLTISKDKE